MDTSMFVLALEIVEVEGGQDSGFWVLDSGVRV